VKSGKSLLPALLALFTMFALAASQSAGAEQPESGGSATALARFVELATGLFRPATIETTK
jgi:hypothetical protein